MAEGSTCERGSGRGTIRLTVGGGKTVHYGFREVDGGLLRTNCGADLQTERASEPILELSKVHPTTAAVTCKRCLRGDKVGNAP